MRLYLQVELMIHRRKAPTLPPVSACLGHLQQKLPAWLCLSLQAASVPV